MINRKLGLALLLTLLVASSQAQTPKPKAASAVTAGTHTTGRYQLFQGSYYALSSQALQEDAVFMIDTETGRTWVFSKVWNATKTGSAEGWVPLSEMQLKPVEPSPQP